MPKILVCQHVPYELLGTLDPLFRNSRFRIKYNNFSRHPDSIPKIDTYDGLVVLGGPMNVDETDKYPHLAYEVDLIRETIHQKKPVLGICLGAQLTAKALGAKVKKNKVKEIGWYKINLTNDGKNDAVIAPVKKLSKIFQWHGDTFDIPDGATHLASSPDCANQAFKYKDFVYGFQFHLEVDEATIKRWLVVPENEADVAEMAGISDPQKILDETPHYIDELKQVSNEVFNEFIKLFGEKKVVKKVRLGSV